MDHDRKERLEALRKEWFNIQNRQNEIAKEVREHYDVILTPLSRFKSKEEKELESLFKKYLEFVYRCEGTDFVGYISRDLPNDVDFTEEEIDYLESIAFEK